MKRIKKFTITLTTNTKTDFGITLMEDTLKQFIQILTLQHKNWKAKIEEVNNE